MPAYNEGPRISNVLKVLVKCSLIDEIIVINDGSTDDTAKQVRKFRKIKLVSLKKNVGKTKAMIEGMKIAKREFFMFIDSDIIGLTQKDLQDIISPVINDQADITISLRAGGLNIYKYIGVDFISGDRVFHRNLLNKRKLEKLQRYGLESYMNEEVIKNKKRVKIVRWDNVKMTFKAEKEGFVKGIFSEIIMIVEIFKTIGFFGPIKQMIMLTRLKI